LAACDTISHNVAEYSTHHAIGQGAVTFSGSGCRAAAARVRCSAPSGKPASENGAKNLFAPAVRGARAALPPDTIKCEDDEIASPAFYRTPPLPVPAGQTHQNFH